MIFADQPVAPGDYTIVFKKTGYEPIQKLYRVAAEGVIPPFEELKLEFKPKEELRLTVDAARKEIEEHLRRLSERIQLSVKAGGVGLWERNLETGRLWWDGRMLEMYGVDPGTSEITYDLWASRLHPEDRPRIEAQLRDAIAGIAPYDTEFRVIMPNGAVRYLRTMASLIRKPDGSPLLLTGTNWETTETHRLTDALSKLLGKTAVPSLRVRPEILGGVVVRAGDRIFDGSLRRRLDRLRRQLMSTGLQS